MGCLASLSALGAAVVLAAAGDQPLRIGTEAPFTPYVMVAPDGSLSGFEFDLMTEVCARQALDCQWQLARFDELIPGLQEGRFDVVLGGMAITPERRARVDFTEPYHHADDVEWFIGRPGAPLPAAARIAVQAGTVHAAYLQARALDYRAYPTEGAVLDALAAGKADLAFGPFEARPELQTVFDAGGFDLLYDVTLTDEGTGMAVCKGNAPLLSDLNAALAAIAADGTLADLETRWF